MGLVELPFFLLTMVPLAATLFALAVPPLLMGVRRCWTRPGAGWWLAGVGLVAGWALLSVWQADRRAADVPPGVGLTATLLPALAAAAGILSVVATLRLSRAAGGR